MGVSREYVHHLERHPSGYELEPDIKIMRDFAELCEVISYYCCNIEGLTGK